ncbi:MAG: type II secretion system major pseudopilin GspG [Burkholderiales bacterium]|nr:type II secretion system major pseudopilin GspG [Burkholderiales bacterium]MDE1925906.1 type II secretion system major pseudopilin GspG [Burkholderiales bacterium]MDE2157423.1 type II secretion system major pseudopilin GspG [Burkholderiales bacterium]
MTARPSSRARPAAGFTLLEMLVVLVIIGLVAGLVGPRLFSKVDTSKVQTAGVQIKLLRGAIETMRMDIGIYPPADVGLSMLVTPPTDPALRARWKGPYLDEAVPLDPWNNPYQYQVPGDGGRPFSIISLGADGKPGGEGIDADIGHDMGAVPAPQ